MRGAFRRARIPLRPTTALIRSDYNRLRRGSSLRNCEREHSAPDFQAWQLPNRQAPAAGEPPSRDREPLAPCKPAHPALGSSRTVPHAARAAVANDPTADVKLTP
jgi:hypothetical protein